MYKKWPNIKYGIQINNLTVIEDAPPKMFKHKNGVSGFYKMVKCKCHCGALFTTYWNNLRSGQVKSCGCVKKYLGTHGLHKHPLYFVRDSMIARCYRESSRAYKNYGAKGVRVCKEWLDDFMSFYNWAINNGWKRDLQIDKDIKGNGFLYSPENCCFVTAKENMRNRTNSIYVDINGKKMSVLDISIKYGIPYTCVYQRLKRGISGEKLLSKSKSETWSSNRRKTT